MKILVPVKRVIDYNVKIRVNSERSAVETNNVKMSSFRNRTFHELLGIARQN